MPTEEGQEARRALANAEALRRLTEATPMLVGVAPAGDVVPGMEPHVILTSGAPLDWPDYTGGQRRAVLHGAVYEGLADSPEQADERIRAGRILVRATQQHSCIGSVAGIYTASMPVLVAEETTTGTRAYCNLYEGESRHRLNYGSYNAEVAAGLDMLRDLVGPLLGRVLDHQGPLDLMPMMARALRLGDELHSRNTAGTLLFTRALTETLMDLDAESGPEVRRTLAFLAANDYFFLRVSMVAAKAIADSAHGVAGSSLLTGMSLNCRNFCIRVSGLGDEWFVGEHPVLDGRYFDGHTAADAEWIGGESCVTETVGLGGFAQACAPTLQAYQGGTYEAMLANNLAMYDITAGEHPTFLLPPLGFRGSPVGIDVFEVLGTGITPVIDGGLAGKDGGQIGAGVLRPHLDVFEAAAQAYTRTHGSELPTDTTRG